MDFIINLVCVAPATVEAAKTAVVTTVKDTQGFFDDIGTAIHTNKAPDFSNLQNPLTAAIDTGEAAHAKCVHQVTVGFWSALAGLLVVGIVVLVIYVRRWRMRDKMMRVAAQTAAASVSQTSMLGSVLSQLKGAMGAAASDGGAPEKTKGD